MNSIFVLTKTNFDFLKTPASMESCLAHIGNAPYWQIYGRICYHHDETPTYILHNNIVMNNTTLYDDYLHITNIKKPLYAITHYKLSEIQDMAKRLHLPQGTKPEMYKQIASYIQEKLK